MIIDTDDPDILGEYWRDQFFDQTKGRGCYSTFDVKENIQQLPDEIFEYETWKVYSAYFGNMYVRMRYFWDGDGTLEFHFSDGRCLMNDDCKKSYGWKWNYSE